MDLARELGDVLKVVVVAMAGGMEQLWLGEKLKLPSLYISCIFLKAQAGAGGKNGPERRSV